MPWTVAALIGLVVGLNAAVVFLLLIAAVQADRRAERQRERDDTNPP